MSDLFSILLLLRKPVQPLAAISDKSVKYRTTNARRSGPLIDNNAMQIASGHWQFHLKVGK